MNKPINSPFRYPGGKFYARHLILNHIPSHSYYVEPFAGGGSIFFVKDKVNINWLNDIDELLINTLLIIRRSTRRINQIFSRGIRYERKTYILQK